MGAMTLEKLLDLDNRCGSHSSQLTPAREARESNLAFWEEALLEELIPKALAESGANPELDALGIDDYQIALVRSENPANPQKRSVQRIRRRAAVWVLPVTWRELVERLRKHGNHPVTEPDSSFQFGEVCVDFVKIEITRSAKVVPVKPLEFKLLRFFTQNPDRVVSRHELLDQVWGYRHYPSTRTVDNHVYFLRRKLEVKPARPRHFVTVHGMGYKFVP